MGWNRDTSLGFAFGAITVMAPGACCLTMLTRLVLDDPVVPGLAAACIAWVIGSLGFLGLVSHRHEGMSWAALGFSLVFLCLMIVRLFGRWCLPTWSLG